MKRVLLFIMAACIVLSFAGCAVGADAGMNGVSVSAGPDDALDNALDGANNNVNDAYGSTDGRITNGNDAPDGHIDNIENGAAKGSDAARNNTVTNNNGNNYNDGNNYAGTNTNNDGNVKVEEPTHNANNTGRVA